MHRLYDLWERELQTGCTDFLQNSSLDQNTLLEQMHMIQSLVLKYILADWFSAHHLQLSCDFLWVLSFHQH